MQNEAVDKLMFDRDQAQQFMEILYGPASGLIHVCSTSDWQGKTFELGDALFDYVDSLDKAGTQGIYARATSLRETPAQYRRGSEDESMELFGLWADIDISGVGHKSKKVLPPDLDEAKKIFTESGMPEPTLLIHSGGGIYPWWLLTEPMDIRDENARDHAKALVVGLQKVLAHTASTLGYHYGTEVGDLARVLRIPGTVNRKEGLQRPCEIIGWGERTFTLDELTSLVMDLVATIPEPVSAFEQSATVALSAAEFGDRPGDDFNTRASWQSILINQGWNFLYQRGGTWYLRRPGKREGISATIVLEQAP